MYASRRFRFLIPFLLDWHPYRILDGACKQVQLLEWLFFETSVCQIWCFKWNQNWSNFSAYTHAGTTFCFFWSLSNFKNSHRTVGKTTGFWSARYGFESQSVPIFLTLLLFWESFLLLQLKYYFLGFFSFEQTFRKENMQFSSRFLVRSISEKSAGLLEWLLFCKAFEIGEVLQSNFGVLGRRPSWKEQPKARKRNITYKNAEIPTQFPKPSIEKIFITLLTNVEPYRQQRLGPFRTCNFLNGISDYFWTNLSYLLRIVAYWIPR